MLTFDSMRVRGIHRVTAEFPRQDRLKIEAIVNDAANSLLPENIWGAWPDCLVASGLVAASPSTPDGASAKEPGNLDAAADDE